MLLTHKLLLSGAWALAFLAPPVYKTYHNVRFDYLADFRLEPEPQNGDGRRFVCPDGQITLTAFAGYAAAINGLDKRRKVARADWQAKRATLALDQFTRTGYVLSGQVKDHICYERIVFKNDMLTTFIWEYPATRKATIDAVIQHTFQTLQHSVGGS